MLIAQISSEYTTKYEVCVNLKPLCFQPMTQKKTNILSPLLYAENIEKKSCK